MNEYPELSPLREKLLSFGGKEIVPRSEPDLDKLLSKRGRVWGKPKIIMREGDSNKCHSNVSRLWRENRPKFRIVTGWALTDDDQTWRQHSWGLWGHKIVETTMERDQYFGVVLTPAESKTFMYNNW